LEQDPSLTPTERRSLGELRVGHAVRLADRQRDEGNLRGAEASLRAALRDYPRDPLLLGALARAREQDGDADSAHALYLEVLRSIPDDSDALRGAVDTAIARGDLDEARALLRSAGAGAGRPDDPRLLQLAAHLAEREGDDLAVRQRQGEQGLSALTEVRGAANVEVPIALVGRLTLRISEVQLDAGPVAVSAGPRFGTGAPGGTGPQRALGTELHATYES